MTRFVRRRAKDDRDLKSMARADRLKAQRVRAIGVQSPAPVARYSVGATQPSSHSMAALPDCGAPARDIA